MSTVLDVANRGPCIPFGRAVNRCKDSGAPELPPLSVYLEAGVVPRSSREDNHNRLGADLSNYLVVRPGDIVFNKLRTWQGGLGASDYHGIVSPAYFVCRPLEAFEPRFLHYLLRSAPYLAEFGRISKFMPPSQFDISWDDLRNIPVPRKPLGEQRAIADFLDAETARIDALIDKKRRLINTVTEWFEAAVYSAVTGKDYSGLHRQSGVAWIGEVPAHWGVPWLGAHYSTQLGKMLNADAAGGPEQHPYLRNVNVQWDQVDLTDVATMHFSADDRRRCLLRPGDLLVCEGGEVGRAAVWSDSDREMYFQKAIHRVRPLADGNARYLMYCLWAAARMDVFTVEGNQSTIVHLTGEKLREHRFPYPPVNEQDRIASTIDGHRSRAQSLVFSLEKQIDLLSEHRRALITSAVTGELDIPGVAA